MNSTGTLTETSSVRQSIAILYHKSCNDGVTAAAIAYASLTTQPRHYDVNYAYIPVNYGEDLPTMEKNQDWIYVLDFCYSQEQLKKLSEYLSPTGTIIVLDHHESAENMYKHLPLSGQYRKIDLGDMKQAWIHIDQCQSGATLALKYFFRHMGKSFYPGTHEWELGQLVANYARDRDLFLFETEKPTRQYGLFCRRFNNDPQGLGEHLLNSNSELFQKTLEPFEPAVVDFMSRCRSLANKAAFGYLDGRLVAVLNCESDAVSDTSKYIYDRHVGVVDYVMCFQMSPSMVFVSLRSHVSGTNVEQVAKAHGGGGHIHASGCSMSLSELMVILQSFDEQAKDANSKIRTLHPHLFGKK